MVKSKAGHAGHAPEPEETKSEARTETERGRTERSRRPTPEVELRNLRFAVRNAPVILWAMDRDGIFTMYEGKGVEAAGRKPGELVGQRVRESFADVPGMEEMFGSVLAGNPLHRRMELAGRHYQVACDPLRQDGNIVGLVGVATDITAEVESRNHYDKARARFDTVLAAVTEGLLVTDRRGRITQANRAAQEILGYSESELREPGIHDHIHPVLRDGGYCDAATCPILNPKPPRTGVAPEPSEQTIIRRDGRRVVVEVVGATLGMGADQQGSVAVIRDISRRREAEKEHRRNEALYKLVTRHARDLVTCHNPDGTVTYASPACRRVLGMHEQELVGRRLEDLVHQEDRRRVHDLLSDPALRHGSERIRYRMMDKFDNVVWIEAEAQDVEDTNLASTGDIIIVSTDVTHLRRLEQMLRNREDEVRTLTEHASDCITRLAPDGTIRYASPSSERLFGIRPDDMVGTSTYNFVHPDDIPPLRQFHESILAGEQPGSITYRHRGPEGEHIRVESRCRIVRTPDGSQARELLASTHAETIPAPTDEIGKEPPVPARAQTARLQEMEKLERLNAYKTELLGLLSNALRTPLTPLLLDLHALRQNPTFGLPDKAHRMIESIQRNLAHLTETVDNVTRVARTGGGSAYVEPEPVDLTEILERMVDRFREIDPSKRISLNDEGEAHTWVEGDTDRLELTLHTVLNEILSHHDDQSDIEIRSRKRGEQVEVNFRFHAPHIPAQDTADIEASLPGGLPMARSALRLHGGTLGFRGDEDGDRYIVMGLKVGEEG